jgi:hypothetical protein
LQKTFAKYEWLFLKYIQLRSCGWILLSVKNFYLLIIPVQWLSWNVFAKSSRLEKE